MEETLYLLASKANASKLRLVIKQLKTGKIEKKSLGFRAIKILWQIEIKDHLSHTFKMLLWAFVIPNFRTRPAAKFIVL